MKSFWQKLNKPFFCSAPMSGVTDIAFRQMLVKYSKPDVVFTEFVSVDGLSSEGREELLKIMKFKKNEHPIVVQFFGRNPNNFYKAAKLAKEIGFDGVDINMGCPDKSISGKQGAGAALMKDIPLAIEIIKATKKSKLPVSVKMRLGFGKKNIGDWILDICDAGISAVTIHGRTRVQCYGGEADWDKIGEISKKIKDRFEDIVVIGNGDVDSVEDGISKSKKYELDGIMVGRKLLGSPGFFGDKIFEKKDKIEAAIEHTKLFKKYFDGDKNFDSIKKHYANYMRGFNGAKELRIKLMKTRDIDSAKDILKSG